MGNCPIIVINMDLYHHFILSGQRRDATLLAESMDKML
jgi:hypothetical protein